MTSVTDNFRQYERMEGRTLTIDGAEFADSREKLEADILAHYKTPEEKLKTVREWLDRQAAITRRECHEGIGSRANSICDELHKRIADLQAERDQLGHERDLYRENMLAQAGRVAELEAELAKWEKLTNGIELPSQPITEFQPKDKDRRIAELEAQLRECDENRIEFKGQRDYAEGRIAELEAERDEIARAYKERGRIIAELREQLRNDDEPFCETVKRWLSDDAPEECLECEDGCWREMHELMARDCDECEPMLAAEREILELKAFCERVEKTVENGDDLALFGVDYVPAEKLEDEKAENGWAREFLDRIGPKCGKPDCPSLVAYVEQLEEKARRVDEADSRWEYMRRDLERMTAERDHLQGVVMQQAESFRKLEAASAMPADCTECKHLDELRKLKRRIAKLARKAWV